VQLDAQHSQSESQPKTVYSDRLDFTHGVPQRKSAAATPADGNIPAEA